jgi:hypothetical protein
MSFDLTKFVATQKDYFDTVISIGKARACYQQSLKKES